MKVPSISIETDNHFESNAANATDKESISHVAQHIKYDKSTGFEQGFELLQVDNILCACIISECLVHTLARRSPYQHVLHYLFIN